MPCMSFEDCGVGLDPRREDAYYLASLKRDKEKTAYTEADKVTQKLCYLMGELTEDGIIGRYMTPLLENWWTKHKAHDEERVLRKMQETLSDNDKLTAPALALRFIDEAERVHSVSRYHKKWFLACAEQVKSECGD